MFNQHKKARGYNLVMLLLIVLVGSMGLLISFNSSVSSPTGYLGKEVYDVEQRNHYGWEGDVLLVPKEECADSDLGANIYENGKTIDTSGKVHIDVCMDSSNVHSVLTDPEPIQACSGKFCKLHEGYCFEDKFGNKFLKVREEYCPKPFVCYEGTCIIPSKFELKPYLFPEGSICVYGDCHINTRYTQGVKDGKE